MSIDIDAMLIFGAPYRELQDLENLNELLDSGELDYASPYYDSPRDTWIVGIELASEAADESELTADIREAREVFEDLTDGAKGRIIVSPHIT